MKFSHTRGWLCPFLLAIVLFGTAVVPVEVSAVPAAQASPVPTITQRQVIEIAINSDDSSPYFSDCHQYESNPAPDLRLNEIYIGYCGTPPNIEQIVSGLRFSNSKSENGLTSP